MTEKELERIDKIWKKQIKKDPKFKVHRALFYLTLNFTFDDWRKIRTEKYWSMSDSLDYDAQKKYTLKCVKYYIKNLQSNK
jgi:hypothetical protein